MTAAPIPADEDPEVARDVELAAEHATHFKRVLDGMRIYPKGHKTLLGYQQGLFEKLAAALSEDHDELSMVVTPLGFAVHGNIVMKADALGDSITHPLYLDGVKRLTVVKGLTEAELQRFMTLWRETLDELLGDTHTFSTRVWEEDFEFLEIVSLDSFGDGPKGPDGRSGKERLQSAIEALAGREEPAPDGTGEAGGGARKLRRILRISGEDLRQLKARGIPQLSEADLARLAGGEKVKPPGLTDLELAALIKELLAQHDKVVERVFDALFLVSTDSTPAEQESLSNALAIVLAAMSRAGRIDRIRDNLMRQVNDARKGDPMVMDLRMQTLSRLLKALRRPDVFGPLVVALDDDAVREAALIVLKLLPSKSESLVLDWLGVPERPEGRKVLADLVMTLEPDPADVAARIGWSDPDLALELVRIGAALGEPGWPVRKAGLAHLAQHVQVASVKSLDKATIAAHRTELFPLLSSPLPEIREALFTTLVASRDPHVAPALCTLLRRQKLDDAERRRVLIALVTLGGPEACGTLRQVLEKDPNADLQLLAAGALGNLGDEKARPLLEAAANKVLFGGPLKKAAQEALKRLDAAKKGANA